MHSGQDDAAGLEAELDDVRDSYAELRQSVIRGNAAAALAEAGAVSPRIVDLFLADMGEKLAIDSKTGEMVGLDNLVAWKEANVAFFNPAKGGVAVDAGGKSKTFREMTPAERKQREADILAGRY